MSEELHIACCAYCAVGVGVSTCVKNGMGSSACLEQHPWASKSLGGDNNVWQVLHNNSESNCVTVFVCPAPNINTL